MNRTYTIRDFAVAQLEENEYQAAHPHLKTYFSQKAQAFRAAFQMPLNERVVRGHHNSFRSFYNSALSSYTNIRTPFSAYIEMTQEMATIADEYEAGFAVLVQQMQEVHLNFILALLERWYGPSTRTISSEDLLRQGFDDDASGPDPNDYF